MNGDSSSNALLAPAGFVIWEAEGQGAVLFGVTRRSLWACTFPCSPGPGSVFRSAGREGGASVASKDKESPVPSDGACSLSGH